jgi:hypothetical protein
MIKDPIKLGSEGRWLNLAALGRDAWNTWSNSEQHKLLEQRATVDFSGGEIVHADWAGFTFPGRARFDNAKFRGHAFFSSAHFMGEVSFDTHNSRMRRFSGRDFPQEQTSRVVISLARASSPAFNWMEMRSSMAQGSRKLLTSIAPPSSMLWNSAPRGSAPKRFSTGRRGRTRILHLSLSLS